MGADYLFCVKSIATLALTFFGYIISVLASVNAQFNDNHNFIIAEVHLHTMNTPVTVKYILIQKIKTKKWNEGSQNNLSINHKSGH